ncbi:MAG: DivIVA domain-containing protein [Acidobacteriota bacterium]
MFDPALSPQPPSFDTVRGEARRVTVSPIDLRQRIFRSRLNGFDKAEVAAFIVSIADDYEHALQEADQLRQELARMEPILKEHREGERTLRNTLLTAQRLSDEMKERAEQEGRRIVSEAEGLAAVLLEQTQARLVEMEQEIDGLGLRRREIEATLEGSIATLRQALDYVRERANRESAAPVRDRAGKGAGRPAAEKTASDAAPSGKTAVSS